MKDTCLNIQRETVSQKTKKTYRQKWMIKMMKKRKINADVEPKESEYRHKGGNIYNQEQRKKKNIVRSHHRSLR